MHQLLIHEYAALIVVNHILGHHTFGQYQMWRKSKLCFHKQSRKLVVKHTSITQFTNIQQPPNMKRQHVYRYVCIHIYIYYMYTWIICTYIQFIWFIGVSANGVTLKYFPIGLWWHSYWCCPCSGIFHCVFHVSSQVASMQSHYNISKYNNMYIYI